MRQKEQDSQQAQYNQGRLKPGNERPVAFSPFLTGLMRVCRCFSILFDHEDIPSISRGAHYNAVLSISCLQGDIPTAQVPVRYEMQWSVPRHILSRYRVLHTQRRGVRGDTPFRQIKGHQQAVSCAHRIEGAGSCYRLVLPSTQLYPHPVVMGGFIGGCQRAQPVPA